MFGVKRCGKAGSNPLSQGQYQVMYFMRACFGFVFACACSFASHHSIHSLTLASRRYIIVDIQLIMTGKSRRIVCSVDDYALASLMLYLDIVKLFLEIIGAIDRNPK